MKSLFLLCFLFPYFVLSASETDIPWKDRHIEGWAWYQDPKKFKIPPDKTLNPKQTLDIAKEELENSLAQALLNPIEENVKAYIILQKKWIDQSRLFAESWQRAILENPEIAYFYPTSQYGVQVKKAFQRNQIKELISLLSKSSTLLLLYEGMNPYSNAFAQVVRTFSLENNWPLKSISVDGVISKELPDSFIDQMIAKDMELSVFPALFLVDSLTGSTKPLAFGMETISSIEESIVFQFLENSQ